MHKSNFYISFGVWLFILPFLGIPGSWKNILVSLSGIFLILLLVGPKILNSLQVKPKSSILAGNKIAKEKEI
jgi:hypothetical protein